MDVIGVGASPALHYVQGVAIRLGIFVDPYLGVFEGDGIDNQGVALPMSYFFTEEGRLGIFGMFASFKWTTRS